MKKEKYEYDLNSDLTVIGLIYCIIIFGCIHLNVKYNEYVLQHELLKTKKVAVDLYNESKYTYYIIDDLNRKIAEKEEELKEFNDLKQLKDDVREFWNRR